MKLSDWIDIAVTVREIWPASQLPDGTVKAWFPFLADLDVDDVRQAVARLALDPDQRYAPHVGTIRDAAESDGLGRGDWTAAWARLVEAQRTADRRPSFDDPALDTFVGQLGRWVDITGRAPHGYGGDGRGVNLRDPALRAQFRDFYRDYHARLATARRSELAATVTAQLDGSPLQALGPGDRR